MAKKSQEIDQENETQLSISRSTAMRLSIAGDSDLSITACFARRKGDEAVLLPLAEWSLNITPINEGGPASNALLLTLPLDNIAFLLADLSGEFKEETQNLISLLQNGSMPHAISIDQTIQWLEQTAANAQEAAQLLSELNQINETAGEH
ncbi:hypothetical protein [Roseovarius sp.]|uniref:hypothetical protein n=1 Tax=Roseovarius sp. TaxID=1486281 RepID=UPI00262F342B|nr:hypothetical protein [Roseovarius sp.]